MRDDTAVRRQVRTSSARTLFATVSWSKKNAAPARAWERKSDARYAIHLKIEKPAPDLRTNMAIACCRMRPTMTVALARKHQYSIQKKSIEMVNVPWDVLAVPGGGPEAELEDEQTEDRDRTVAVGGAL